MISVRADYGGGPEHIYRLITNLSPEVQVYIASPMEKPYYEKYKALVGQERMIEIPHRKFTIPDLFALIRFLRKNKIDIVHSHGKGAGIYSRVLSILTGIPVIHTFHGIHTDKRFTPRNSMYLFTERLLSKFTLKLIAVSDGEYRKAVRLKIAPERKITVVKNGVVIPSKRVNDPYLQKPYNILTITRFDKAKNTELLIQVIDALVSSDEINDFRFTILGEGEGMSNFRSMVEEKNYGVYMNFAGTTDNTSEYYLRSFCYISTSKGEGLPLAVMEAMSFGLPVVATDVTGNKDLVEHGLTGFLYPLDNPARAASILSELSKNKELWLRVSERSANKIKDGYSVKRMADETMKLYFSLNK